MNAILMFFIIKILCKANVIRQKIRRMLNFENKSCKFSRKYKTRRKLINKINKLVIIIYRFNSLKNGLFLERSFKIISQ